MNARYQKLLGTWDFVSDVQNYVQKCEEPRALKGCRPYKNHELGKNRQIKYESTQESGSLR